MYFDRQHNKLNNIKQLKNIVSILMTFPTDFPSIIFKNEPPKRSRWENRLRYKSTWSIDKRVFSILTEHTRNILKELILVEIVV